jgi:hypothetical protein
VRKLSGYPDSGRHARSHIRSYDGSPDLFPAREMRHRFNWRFFLLGTSATALLCLVDALLESDGLLYFFVVIPLVSLVLIIFILAPAASKNPRSLAVPSVLVLFWLVSFLFVKNHFVIRSAERWALQSRYYKAEVLRQTSPSRGELKHIEWDGWGYAGAETNVYLVFDPTDSISAAVKNRQEGKYAGIPCSVPMVRRLERQWYAVVFYTDEAWGKPHYDCGMND